MSDISSLRAELSRQERINRELKSQLYELANGVSRADSELAGFRNHVTGTLADSSHRLVNSHERIIQAYEIQGEIDRLYVRFKNMELANKKIRECNNKKYYDFGNYRTVRKLVQGIMDNMDVQMVSDEIIYKSVEKQHLMTPDYWLTCVLISVMAWKNDDRPLADRAMAKAIELDKKESSIFYMLFNIRSGREDAALKWFTIYQECDLKGSDERTFLMLFSLLSKTMDEQVDDYTKYEIYGFINRVIALNAQAEGFSEEQVVGQIQGYLTAMKQGDVLELNLLKKCCDDYGRIAEMVSLAQNNMQILQFILDVGNVSELERNEYLSKFIDEEIERPNSVEREVYDEIEYNEMVIRCDGDVERARKLYAAEQERREKELNLIREMVQWVYAPGNAEVNGQVRKNMFTLTGTLQKKAVEQYAQDYRQMEVHQHPVTLGEYRTTADFNNQSAEHAKIEAFYQAQKEERLAAIKAWPAYVAFALGVAAAGGALYLGVLTLLAGTVVGAAVGIYVLVSGAKQKKQIEKDCLLNVKGKTDLMDKVFVEYEKMRQIYSEYDVYQERISEEMDKL
ncbi:hypothetical protein ABXS75_15890 [Roseburia hominis]